MSGVGKRLVVVPTDSIATYEKAGYDWLGRYFNPQGLFEEVYALSPKESGERTVQGIRFIGAADREFKGKLKALKPDVVRAYGGFWPADLVCRNRLPGVPVLVSVHDTNPDLLHRSVLYADMVICMSKVVARKVEEIGTSPERIRILPNRVDTNAFRPIRDRALLEPVASRFPPGRHILHIGRRTDQKNADTLIRALALLPPDYACIFVGLGDNAPYIALSEEVGVSDRCVWIDAVKNAELPLWYSWADCLCVPSRWEGFGIIFIEAAACGAPIVTSDIAPMNEFLRRDESACLVKDYENPQSLAAAIRKICEDKPYRNALSAGAVQMARQFDVSVVDEMEAALYREALSLGRLPFGRRLEIAGWRAGETMEGAKARWSRTCRPLARKLSLRRIARAVKRRLL
ncbi:MAG: glycosyltransferase family 4 protein [Armatimonadetes bacterium]|nr:glycosyltransferase family 4 protein [Armatimonadota bacterium]